MADKTETGRALTDAPVTGTSSIDLISAELSSRRTGMSFQRTTRMSADRTLMSVIRTSLSLIGFGFTIFQFFRHLGEAQILSGGVGAARNFGIALVFIGVAMLVLGIAYHVHFMIGLRAQRRRMMAAKIVHGESGYPVSLTLIVAVLLLATGLVAVVSMVFHIAPFA
jgi:putative membrane protein